MQHKLKWQKTEKEIPIDTSLSVYQHAAINARCNLITNTKYLDFDGIYYKVNKVNPKGKFVEIEKCDEISFDSCVYIDSKLRNYIYNYKDSSYAIYSFLEQKKYLILDVWTEFCPPCIRDIPKLNILQEKYSDKVTILGLFDGISADLLRMEENYNIKYQVGILSEKIKADVLQSGYPYKVIISPNGKIIKMDIRKTSEIEEFIKKL